MRTIIATKKAPGAVGPYSQGTKIANNTGSTAYISGQIPLLPESGEMVPGGIEAQTKQVLDNLQAVIEAAGSSLAQVLKITIYVVDMNDFAVVNGIYAEYFRSDPPARATVEVGALPKGALVEMDAIVFCPGKDNE